LIPLLLCFRGLRLASTHVGLPTLVPAAAAAAAAAAIRARARTHRAAVRCTNAVTASMAKRSVLL
jgi:hypothetical protein